MATALYGRLIESNTKSPLIGVTVEAINASTGVAGGNAATDTQGFYSITSLASAKYFAKPLIPSFVNWDIQPDVNKLNSEDGTIGGWTIGTTTLTGAVGDLVTTTVDSAGRLLIERKTATPVNPIGYIVENLTNSGSQAINSDTNAIIGYAIHTGAGATTGTGGFVGITASVRNETGAGTLAVADGLKVGVQTAAGTTITDATGITISTTEGGTITNGKSLYITGLSAAATHWAIHSDAAAQSAIAGNLRIGSTTAPTVALDVTGVAIISSYISAAGVLSDANLNAFLGKTAALATNATDGFVSLPSMSGTPTGTPTSVGNSRPVVIDVTAGKLWSYYNAGWHYVTFT